MNELFLKITNMSISASWLVLAVLILRFVLKKAPKWLNVLLWGIVAVRLICPFSIESTLSLIPSSETIPLDIEMAATPEIDSGIPAINSAVNPVLSSFAPPKHTLTSANPLQIWIPILSVIWMAGVAILLLYTTVSYWILRSKVNTAVRYKYNIFQSENVSTPFVLGIIKPRIYLPFKLDEQNLKHIVAHERAHIRRKDHWWKPLGFLLLTLHWFNPLMWLSYVLLCRDIELACDEKVIKKLGNEQRADYTQALVACSLNRRMITACPLAFGEVGVKERVKAVMNYKKPAFWVLILSVAACVVLMICFLTNPIKEGVESLNDEPDGLAAESTESVENSLEKVKDISYHLEMAAGTEFQDMNQELQTSLLAEYKDLVEDYIFLARESKDGSAAYLVGQYNGNSAKSPFDGIYDLDVYTAEDEFFRFLYREEAAGAVEALLSANQTDFSAVTGYHISESRILWSADRKFIMIQPKTSELLLDVPWNRYLYTPNGREYIVDAVSRGIDVCGRTDTYLYIYRISEHFGELAERIALTEAEAQAILAEKHVGISEGFGFSATLHIGDQTTYYNEREGIPQTVLDLAVEKCDYRFVDPGNITDTILEAELDCEWLDAPLYASEGDLLHLQEILKNAEQGYVGSCGYQAKLTLTFADGEKLTAFKGCDSCDTIVFGSYGGYLLGEKENVEFWEIFGLDPESKL